MKEVYREVGASAMSPHSPVLSCTPPSSRTLGRIGAVSGPYRGRNGAVSGPYRGCIGAVSGLYRGRIGAVSGPVASRHFGSDRVGRAQVISSATL